MSTTKNGPQNWSTASHFSWPWYRPWSPKAKEAGIEKSIIDEAETTLESLSASKKLQQAMKSRDPTALVQAGDGMIWVNEITTSLRANSLEIIVSKGNHPQMALIQVSELL